MPVPCSPWFAPLESGEMTISVHVYLYGALRNQVGQSRLALDLPELSNVTSTATAPIYGPLASEIGGIRGGDILIFKLIS